VSLAVPRYYVFIVIVSMPFSAVINIILHFDFLCTADGIFEANAALTGSKMKTVLLHPRFRHRLDFSR
jgi:hypothetical protein